MEVLSLRMGWQIGAIMMANLTAASPVPEMPAWPAEELASGDRQFGEGNPESGAEDRETQIRQAAGTGEVKTFAIAGSEDQETQIRQATETALISTDGLLMRRASISESILLLETQLRQAKLIAELLELLGPDAQIEIAPGEFRDFSATPAGRRIAQEIEEAGMRARIRRIELETEAVTARAILTQAVAPLIELIEASEQPGQISVQEIYGTTGEFRAVLMIDDRPVAVRSGDRPAPDLLVGTITASSVEITAGDDTVSLSLDP